MAIDVKIPVYLIPPPKIFLLNLASSMKPYSPNKILPIGAPIPLPLIINC